MNVAVVGAGYVGLVTSACLAELGHRVTAIEIDPDRLAALVDGRLPIYEPGLDALVERNVAASRLAFVGEFETALLGAEMTFVAVPTPPLENGQADTRHVFSAVRSVLEHAPANMTLVVKSTVPVGTCDEVARLANHLDRSDVAVVSNPEFLRQGSAVRDCFEPDRIVIGSREPVASEHVAALYRGIDAPIIRASRRSAELAKYAANALLATRISFMNEIAAVCDATGANVDEVAHIVGLDTRIGPHFLRAGLGWGGSCFPKDVLALASMASVHGAGAPILEAVLAINQRQRDIAFDMIRAVTSGTNEARVTVLGLAFKPDTDDLRGAPAMEIIARLRGDGVSVAAHDPVAGANAARLLPDVAYHGDAYSAVAGADVVLVATEWKEYLELDWPRVLGLMRGRTVIDGRNVLDRDALHGAGFRYLAFGRGGSDFEHAVVELDAAAAHARTVGRKPADRVPVAEPAA